MVDLKSVYMEKLVALQGVILSSYWRKTEVSKIEFRGESQTDVKVKEVNIGN